MTARKTHHDGKGRRRLRQSDHRRYRGRGAARGRQCVRRGARRGLRGLRRRTGAVLARRRRLPARPAGRGRGAAVRLLYPHAGRAAPGRRDRVLRQARRLRAGAPGVPHRHGLDRRARPGQGAVRGARRARLDADAPHRRAGGGAGARRCRYRAAAVAHLRVRLGNLSRDRGVARAVRQRTRGRRAVAARRALPRARFRRRARGARPGTAPTCSTAATSPRESCATAATTAVT